MIAPQMDYGYQHHQQQQQQMPPSHQQHDFPRSDNGNNGHHQQQQQGKMFGYMDGNDLHHVMGGGNGNNGPASGHMNHNPSDFDHEPLVLNMHNANQGFFPPGGNGNNPSFLQVSSDFQHHVNNPHTPSHTPHTPHTPTGYHHMSDKGTPRSGQKRSREELNMKEKRRMFKLNERINELKALLDGAGIASKKNKQSILDNTTHYIHMLQNDLIIAKQKADRAEKFVEHYKSNNNIKDSESGRPTKRQMLESSIIPSFQAKLNGGFLFGNKLFFETTGFSEQELQQSTNNVLSLLSSNVNKSNHMISSAIQQRTVIRNVEVCNFKNKPTRCSVSVSARFDNQGNALDFECALMPIGDEVEKNIVAPSSLSMQNTVESSSLNMQNNAAETSVSGEEGLTKAEPLPTEQHNSPATTEEAPISAVPIPQNEEASNSAIANVAPLNFSAPIKDDMLMQISSADMSLALDKADSPTSAEKSSN